MFPPTPAQSPRPATPEVIEPVVLSSPIPAPVLAEVSGSEQDESASVEFPEGVILSEDGILDFDEAIFDALDFDESLEKTEMAETETIRGMYAKEHAQPVRHFGKQAIEFENFDFNHVYEEITSLTCFNESHKESLIPLLKLADRDVTSSLSTVNIKNFYKHELIPAMENLKAFKETPEKFHDNNKGQFELYLEENYIVEVPLPARPQIFPHQLRKIDLAAIAESHNEENEKRFLEEEQRIQEEAIELARQQLLASEERLRVAYGQLYQPNMAQFMTPFMYPDVNQNHLPFPLFAPNMHFPVAPPNYFGNVFNQQMYP